MDRIGWEVTELCKIYNNLFMFFFSLTVEELLKVLKVLFCLLEVLGFLALAMAPEQSPLDSPMVAAALQTLLRTSA